MKLLAVLVVISCVVPGIGGLPPPDLQCLHEGHRYDNGDSFYIGCNKCVCTDGALSCTQNQCAELCPPEWQHVGKHCYRAYGKKTSYSEGVAKCSETQGARLVSPTTQEENEELVQFSQFLNRKRRSWLGLAKTTYHWQDGEELTGWTNWLAGNPRDCVSINPWRNFEWAQVSCTKPMAAICQIDIVNYYLTTYVKDRVDDNAEDAKLLHDKQMVFFTVALTKDLSVARESVVVFDHVKDNVGNSYNTTDGIFTCEHPGNYRFDLHVLATPGSYFWLYIKVNDYYLVSVYGHQGTGNEDSASNSAFIPLERGDRVRVVTGYYNATSHMRGDKLSHFVTFSGHLITPKFDSKDIPTPPKELLPFSREFVDSATGDLVDDLKNRAETNSETIYQLFPLNEVLLTAGLKTDLSVPANSPVVFDKVIYIDGASYDSSKGIFTCARTGYYRLDINALALQDKWFWLNVQVNDVTSFSAFAEGGLGNQNSASNNAIVYLTDGDVVTVVTEYFPGVSELRSAPFNAFVTFNVELISTLYDHDIRVSPGIGKRPLNTGDQDPGTGEIISYIEDIQYKTDMKIYTLALPQQVFFSVGLSNDTTVPSGHVVVFNKLLSNYDMPSYNMATGVFTCEHPGYYRFDLNVLAVYGQFFDLSVKLNDVIVVSVTGRAGVQNQDSASNSAFVYLREGDKVHVESGSNPAPSMLRGRLGFGVFVTFSGKLVSADETYPIVS